LNVNNKNNSKTLNTEEYECRSLIETGYPECMTSVDVDEIITKFKKLFIKETING